jgi:hypothetical protein
VLYGLPLLAPWAPGAAFKLSERWNLITRTIVPIIHLPSLEKKP